MSHTEQTSFTFRGRFAARLAAIQALYQLEKEGGIPYQVIQQFLTHHFVESKDIRYIKPDTSLFQKIVLMTWEHKEKVDALISQFISQDWRLERIDSVVRAILRAGTCELLGMTDVPVPVIINEYVNVAKEYFTGKEIAFINGTLDSISKHISQAPAL